MIYVAMPDRFMESAAQLRGCRVMVTGAAGFVGANLLRLLLAAGCELHGVVRPGSCPWRLLDVIEKIRLHEVDMTDELALEAIFERVRPDYVFHLATPRGSSEAARDEMLRFNVFGTVCLSRLVRKYEVRRLVVAGSSLEYAPSMRAMSECSMVSPLTWHGATKAAATLLFRHAALVESLPVVLLRLFHVYGPWESSHRLAPTVIRSAITGAPLKLTEPGIRRDWVFVDDVCEALLLAVDKGQNGDVFNIGSGVETTNEEFVACVESVSGRQINLASGYHNRRITDAEHRFADSTLAREVLGWQPNHDLVTGLHRTVIWHNANPEAWSNADDIYPEAV